MCFADHWTNSLEQYLVRNRLVPNSSGGTNRRDVVECTRLAAGRWTGDASILCASLDQVDDNGAPYWLEWTKNNPDLANCLWAHIAQRGRQVNPGRRRN